MAPNKEAKNLSGYGRNGDSMLMHVQPREVAGLQALARSQGTSLTVNPHTGLPEAFSLGGFFQSMLPTIAGVGLSMVPGIGPIAAGLITGAATTAVTGDLGQGILGGLGGYGGAGLGQNALAGAGSGFKVPVVGAEQAGQAAQNSALIGTNNQPFMPSTPTPVSGINAQVPQYGMTQGLDANSFGPNFNTTQSGGFDPNTVGSSVDFGQSQPMLSAGELAGASSTSSPFMNNLSLAGSNVAESPMAFLNANKMGIGMPLGIAALNSMPQEGMGVEEGEEDKYDPYARLNLGGPSSRGESGLRLLAGGGPVSFAEGGSMQGGGREAMQGAGPINVGSGGGGGGGDSLGLFADQARIEQVLAQQAQMQAAQPQSGMNGKGGIGNQGMTPGVRGGGGDGNMSLIGQSQRNQLSPISLRENINSLNLSDTGQRSLKLAKGGYLDGAGDGMSDSIPATIEGKQPARLADGEFVIPADVVSHLGNGSTKAGSQRLYAMLDKVRHARTGNKKQGKQIKASKFLPA